MSDESAVEKLEGEAGLPVSLNQARVLVALEDFQKSAAAGMDLEAALREATDLIRRPSAILKKL